MSPEDIAYNVIIYTTIAGGVVWLIDWVVSLCRRKR